MKPAQRTVFILFVDDDPEDFEIFRDAFQQVNPTGQLVHQPDCGQALSFLRTQAERPPDYIFLDINMPLMSGDECLKELKADTNLRDIPVIMFSTSISAYDMHTYKKLGAAESFLKPARFADVVKIIQELST